MTFKTLVSIFYALSFNNVFAFKKLHKSETFSVLDENFARPINRTKRWIDIGLRKIFSQLRDTQCYFEEEDDELPALEEQKLPENSIFYLKTSCKPTLTLRECCAVESAARAHPCRPVNVIFIGPATSADLDREPLRTLMKYRNINIYRFHLSKISVDKSMQEVLLRRVPIESAYPLVHTSDFVKFILLNKYGGIYLDLDVIVLQSFDVLPVVDNWLALEDARSHKIGTSMMALTKTGIGKTISDEMLRLLENDYRPKSHNHNSNIAIKKVITKVCGGGYMQTLNTNFCKGLALYDEKYFFPINYRRVYDYFRTGMDMEYFANSFTLHMYHSLTGERPIRNSSLYAEIMHNYCPWIKKRAMVIKIFKTSRNRTKTVSNSALEQYKEQANKVMKMQYL